MSGNTSHPFSLYRPEPYTLESNPIREHIYSVFGQICPESENSRVFHEKADPEKERRYRKSARTENRRFQSQRKSGWNPDCRNSKILESARKETATRPKVQKCVTRFMYNSLQVDLNYALMAD